MEYWIYVVLIGLVVGTLIGLTGIGGGVILLPLLILSLRVPAIVAVGSGAAFSAITKPCGAIIHWRHGNVDWRLAMALAFGSLPGSILGVRLLSFFACQYGDGINEVLSRLLAWLLIVIPLLMWVQRYVMKLQRKGPLRYYVPHWINRHHGAILAGLVGGFLVGLTSVGSGSVIMMLLILFYRLKPVVLVGTDITHAAVLTGATAVAYFNLGIVEPRLVGLLAVGSLPGILLGARLSAFLSGAWLRQALLVVLFASGITML